MPIQSRLHVGVIIVEVHCPMTYLFATRNSIDAYKLRVGTIQYAKEGAHKPKVGVPCCPYENIFVGTGGVLAECHVRPSTVLQSRRMLVFLERNLA